MAGRTSAFTPTKYTPSYLSDISPNRTPGRSSGKRLGLNESERQSGSKYGQDSQIIDIQSSLEAKYAVQIEAWKNRWQNADSKRSFLETENIALVREISFWKNKGNLSDTSKAQRLIDADSNGEGQVEEVKLLVDSQNEALRLETERLRGLLAAKIEESNIIKVNYSKLEIINQENAGKKEIAQDYEIRIQRLKEEYAEKLREIEELTILRNQLEKQSLEARKAQNQADHFKDLLEEKRLENERIRREKLEVQNDFAKQKQVENVLLEKETRLKTELLTLEQKAILAEESRKAAYDEKLRIYKETQESARKNFYEEQLNLEGDIEARQKIAASRTAEAENLKRKYQDLNNDLAVAEEESNNAEAESRVWRAKAQEAEIIRETDCQRAAQTRDVHIQQTIEDTLKEKRQLEGQIGSLNEAVVVRSASLNQIQKESAATEFEKRALEGERVQLLAQIDVLIRKQEDSERIFQSIINQRDNLNSRSLERIRRDHDNEKRRVGNQIQALRNVIDQKREEAERNRRDANQFCLKLVSCENQANQAQGEAVYWRNQTERVSREKDIQYNAERNLTAAQLSDLARVQSLERIQKQREKDGVRGVIQLKDREAEELRRRAQLTGNDIARDRYQQERLAYEAELQRQRALEIEKSKFLELQTKEQFHQSNVDSYLRQANHQTNVLRGEVGQLQNTLVRKDLDANHWRQNFYRLASPIRKY